jgi:hypothetical protein
MSRILTIALCIVCSFDAMAEPASKCKPNENSQYCRDGKVREVCTEPGGLAWTDNRMGVTRGEMNFYQLYVDGPIPTPYCICLDLTNACRSNAWGDCDNMFRECNIVHRGGGRLCIPNRWKGMNCY